jgi:hypothetical protein
MNGSAHTHHVEPNLGTTQAVRPRSHEATINPDICAQGGQTLKMLVNRPPTNLIATWKWHISPPEAGQECPQ